MSASCLFHRGRFCVLQSVAVPPKWSRFGLVRLALLELRSPDGVIPSRIDRRCVNYKRLILLEESVPRNGGRKNLKRYQGLVSHYTDLAKKFDLLWPLHSWAREWPLPREAVFEWPDHLVNKD